MCNTKIRFKLNSCYISREKTDFEEPCNGIVYDHYQSKSITRPNRKIADITLIKSIKSNKIHLCIHIPNRHFELDKNYIFSIKIIDYMIHFYDMKCDIETDIGKWFSSVKDINSSGYFKFRVTELFNTLDNSEVIDFGKMKEEMFTSLEGFATNITTTLPQNIIGFITGLFSGFGVFVLGLIIGFFLIINFDSSSKLFNFVPRKFRETTIELLDDVNGSLRNYVKGAVLDCTLIFVISSIAFWLIGLKAPMLFGLFCGLTNIIPYAGPYIGGAPAVIVGLTQSPTIGILVFIAIFVIQFLEGNFLQPIIMSKTTKLHPVTIMLGLLVFGYFFGIVGMLISTPVIAALKTVFKFYDNKYGIIDKNIDKTTV